MRSLIVKGMDNLLVCGRCLSATHEAGAAVRVAPIAMGVGQAAGVAAALCARECRKAAELPASSVQQALVGLGASIA